MTAKQEPISDYLALDDKALLAQCDLNVYRSSGPGGQHRNKVSSAVKLLHRPTKVGAHGDDSRSQHQNKALAVARLRMEIACRVRRPVDTAAAPPAVTQSCLFVPRGTTLPAGVRRLQVGRKDARFWPVAAYLLDVLQAKEGRLADAAAVVGITTSNFVSVIQDDRHLYAAASEIRKRFGQGPIK